MFHAVRFQTSAVCRSHIQILTLWITVTLLHSEKPMNAPSTTHTKFCFYLLKWPLTAPQRSFDYFSLQSLRREMQPDLGHATTSLGIETLQLFIDWLHASNSPCLFSWKCSCSSFWIHEYSLFIKTRTGIVTAHRNGATPPARLVRFSSIVSGSNDPTKRTDTISTLYLEVNSHMCRVTLATKGVCLYRTRKIIIL